MIFDDLGLPRDSNATDFNDSARLAGIMTLFNWPQRVPLSWYLITKNEIIKYVRHPRENSYDLSRDQAIPLMAGLFISGSFYYVKRQFIDGKDFFSPSHNNHVRICSGDDPTIFGDLWLWLDVLWSCFVAPMAESNQLICMMKVHPNKSYIKFWVKWNKKWRESIMTYWNDQSGEYNRGEPELAELMIKDLERYA